MLAAAVTPSGALILEETLAASAADAAPSDTDAPNAPDAPSDTDAPNAPDAPSDTNAPAPGGPAPDAPDALTAAERARLLALAARGAGHVVLHLGLAHVHTELPPSLAFVREVGKRFVARLCAEPELEERRGLSAPPAPAAEELAELVRALPPMVGAEYVDAARVAAWWDEAAHAFRDEIAATDEPVQAWLRVRGPAWNVVGRVCFHLAENRGDETYPFAFLATYATRASAKGKLQHAPLSRALADSQARGDRAALLSLLVPVARAAEHSPLVKELYDDGDLYHPLAWTPAEAHRFLREIPALEAAGVVVRVPDWWRARRPPRPEVNVTVGGKAPKAGTLGSEAMLDFTVDVALDGEKLSPAELRALLAQEEGLALVRGKWVELDRERLRSVLEHWKTVQRSAGEDGVSFLAGMRLLAGARLGDDPSGDGADDATGDGAAEWTRVQAGEWLGRTLAGLRGPEGLGTGGADPGEALHATLRPYQQTGVSWLWFAAQLRLGVCLADDMGLGKTIQVLALMLLQQRATSATSPRQRASTPAASTATVRRPHLLVVPASLLGNWQAEAARFAPSLRFLVAHPSALPARQLEALAASELDDVDVVLTTYGTVARTRWMAEREWSLVVLDEAQAVKNPGARQTRAVKLLRAQTRVALTGTPVENRLGDLWSIFDFLNPGLLGTARQFSAFTKKLAQRPSEPYAPLRKLVQPYLLRRLKSDPRVVSDLPDKTEVKAFCALARPQAALYQHAVDDLRAELAAAEEGIQRKGVVLAYLLRFKQICNHPSHWLGNGGWAEADSGKLLRLRELGEGIAARQEKVLVFTQFREATAPLAAFLEDVFGRPGLVLHGGTPVKQRPALVARFQNDERTPFFVLSLKAGGTGLNLTAAAHVIHFDRWWNPAVENQATDRAYRIGQKKNVLVHKLICRGTIEEKIDALIEAKQGLSNEMLADRGAETLLTELRDDELMALVSLDLSRAAAET